MTSIPLTVRLEDSGSSTEPIVSTGWQYRVRNSLPYVNGSGDLVDAAWPVGGGWKNFTGATITLDLDPLAADNPYLLEIKRPGDATASSPQGRQPIITSEYRQVLSSTASGTTWWNLTRVSGPGPDGTTYPASGYDQLTAQIASLQAQINALAVGGGGASTLAGITDMSANARSFNGSANYAAMRALLLAAGMTTVDDLTVGDDATITGDLTVSGAVSIPDGALAQAKIAGLVAALAALAPLASPALTGNPTAPTPAADDSDTSVANTAYVQGELADRAKIAGDLAGTADAPVVAKVRGVTVSTTAPTAGQILVATSGTAASWQGSASGVTIAGMPPGSVIAVQKDVTTGFWPSGWNPDGTPIYTGGSTSAGVRPTSRADLVCWWVGQTPHPPIVSSGTAGVRDNIDMRVVLP